MRAPWALRGTLRQMRIAAAARSDHNFEKIPRPEPNQHQPLHRHTISLCPSSLPIPNSQSSPKIRNSSCKTFCCPTRQPIARLPVVTANGALKHDRVTPQRVEVVNRYFSFVWWATQACCELLTADCVSASKISHTSRVRRASRPRLIMAHDNIQAERQEMGGSACFTKFTTVSVLLAYFCCVLRGPSAFCFVRENTRSLCTVSESYLPR